MRRLTLVDRAQGVQQPQHLAGLEDLLGVLDDVPGEPHVVVGQGDCPDFRRNGDCPDFRRENGTVPFRGSHLRPSAAASSKYRRLASSARRPHCNKAVRIQAHAGLAGEFFGGRQVPEHAVPLLRGLEVQQQDDLVLEAGMGGGRGLLGLGQRRQRLAEQLHRSRTAIFSFHCRSNWPAPSTVNLRVVISVRPRSAAVSSIRPAYQAPATSTKSP